MLCCAIDFIYIDRRQIIYVVLRTLAEVCYSYLAESVGNARDPVDICTFPFNDVVVVSLNDPGFGWRMQ